MSWTGRLAFAAIAASAALATALAQYPGHIDPKVNAGPVLRSIAVLEWTGERGKPNASRLIPVAVFHDGEYEAGDLYLARPEPMALDSGTEYQLQLSGQPQGVFDVFTAQQVGTDWFGYGAWKPLPPPEAFHKLHPSHVAPEVVDGGDDRRPHFRKAVPGSDGSGAIPAANPPDDPDRPTLRKRPDAPADASTGSNPSPTAATGDLETATVGGDPDRPKLSRGIPPGQPNGQPKEPAHLEGTPLGLEQMIAVSDADDRKPHPFPYSFSNPDDAAKLQAALAVIAQQAVAKFMAESHAPTVAKTPVAKPLATHTSTGTGTAIHSTSTPHSTTNSTTARRKPAAKPAPAVTLTDVQFHAFELTYSGGATLVFTAHTADMDDLKVKYVTVIAQPDIYGTPQVLFTRVTRGDDLDANPRMRLVDAVDAAADNRGDLLFELRGSTLREFALYRVAGGRVDQLIATAPLPLGKGVS